MDKSLTFQLYRSHDLLLLHPNLQKSFQYDLPYRYLAIASDVHYNTFQEDDDVLSCLISAGHFCE